MLWNGSEFVLDDEGEINLNTCDLIHAELYGPVQIMFCEESFENAILYFSVLLNIFFSERTISIIFSRLILQLIIIYINS